MTSCPRKDLAFTAADFFVLRTPFLPLETLLALSEGLEAMAHCDDPAALASALCRDRQRVRLRLRALCQRPEVREALFIASPSLEAHLDEWAGDPESSRGQKVEASLLRYLLRMAGRPTPFGLFAGHTLGTCGIAAGGGTCLRLQSQQAYRRHTRLDGSYLSALTEALQADATLRQCLTYFPNSSLYRAAGRLRYVEARFVNGVKSYHLVAVEPTPYLSATLQRAAMGARPGELAEAICTSDPGVLAHEAQAFVEELIAHQLLVSELTPKVTGPEPSEDILKQLNDLAQQPVVSRAASVLGHTCQRLSRLDLEAPGAAPAFYRGIATKLERLPAKVELSKLFLVDLVKPAEVARLGREVVAELSRGVQILHRIGGRASRHSLGRFREAFRQRYGDREVPLCEALDEAAGIGFTASTSPHVTAEPLLEGLAFPRAAADAPGFFDERDTLLLRWLSEAWRAGRQEIVLGSAELNALEAAASRGDAPVPLPDSFSAIATILAGSQEAVLEGRYRLALDHVSGPSGMNFLGRFCHRNEELTRHVRAHLRAEEALHPGAMFAEIVHLPQNRTANVLSRPQLRRYEIPYLGHSGAPRECQIPLVDLLLSIVDDRLVLRSRRLQGEIVPRLTTAHDFSGSGNLGVYRFLGALQGQGVTDRLTFSFGALSQAPFLPRVVCGRLVLARARWHLSAEQTQLLSELKGRAQFAAMQSMRRALHIPRWVAVVDRDKHLPVDLDNVLCVEAAVQLFKNRTTRTLVELFYGPDDLFVSGPEGHFVHELVVPFLRRKKPTTMALAAPPRASQPISRRFPPGSAWLYCKLYTGASEADQVLRQVVRPVVREARVRGTADTWFFMRYADPDWHIRLRLHGDKRRLRREVLPMLLDACSSFMADGIIRRVQLDTYEREVERYGGPTGVILAERLFCADSEAVLDIIETELEEPHADRRWRLTLAGIDRLLADLGMELAEKHALVRAARDRFGQEFHLDGRLKRQLGERYRRERARLQSLVSPAPPTPLPTRPDPFDLADRLVCFEKRSLALQPVIAALHEGKRSGRLTQPLKKLAGSFIHMHANRMLRSAARAQELVLYDFLCRLYASQAARASGKPEPGGTRRGGRSTP